MGQWCWSVERAGQGVLLIVCLGSWQQKVVAGEWVVLVEWRFECLCVVVFGEFGVSGEFDVFGEWTVGSVSE